MQFLQAFPIAIIDEDYEGKHAAGRGMRQLAAAIEKEGFRVVAGLSYEDARRLVNVFNSESCWLVSVDGAEATPKQWQILEEVLAAKRSRNDRLPIFLFGDERTAEMVPASVLKHANAFMRLFEDSAEFLARAIARSAQLYLERLPPPMFKALMDYTLHASYSWHTPGHGGGTAFRKSPVGQLFYEFFGENTLRSDISVSVGQLGSLLDHTGPIAEGERNAARIFGADETLFVVGGTSTSNKIVWHGTVSRGDLVLCDRNCHKSILHSLVMTGATPIYLVPSRNGLGIIGPISREQFTPESIRRKIAASPFAKETSGKVRLMVMTNSTYDGLCYNVDAIKQTLGDAVDVLHFDEAWYAYANFHEFYDGYHAISSERPARSPHAITFATQSTHKLLAALSQASMIHVQHGETQRLDMARFNEAFMMHTSTSPQYGIIASCDVAAAMMEQPAGRALVQETIDEALSFRRAMTAVKKQLNGSWWFDVWQPDAMAKRPTDEQSAWVLKPGDRWHGFEEPGREPRAGRPDQGHHPHARVCLPTATCRSTASPPPWSRGSCPPAASRSRRPACTPSWCCSRWASPRASGARSSPSSSTSRICTTPTRRSSACCRHWRRRIRTPTRRWDSRISASRCTGPTARTICPKRRRTCTPRCPRWRCGRPMLTNASCAGAWRAWRSTT